MNLIFKNKSIVKSRISYLNKQIAKTFFNKNFQLDETMQSVKLNYLNTNTPENKELKLAEDTLPLTERTINNQLTRAENLMILKQQLQIANKQTEEETDHKMRIKFAMFILLIGLFSLWVPLYRTICESQGFSVKTNHTDYKFDGKKCKILNINLL